MPSISRKLFAIIIVSSLTLANPAFAEHLSSEQLQQITQKATQGDMQAQADLAGRYHVGDGVDKDVKQAAFWYEKLADSGVAEAQLTLGLMYIRGEGIEKNDQRALHWLNLAAEQRLASAQYLLGLAYAEGHGVQADKVKAYMWYEIAAAMDYENAVEARNALAQQMDQAEIANAEKMATEWWMKFHH